MAQSFASRIEVAAVNGTMIDKNEIISLEKSILNSNDTINSIWYSPKYGEKLAPKGDNSDGLNGHDKEGIFHPFTSKSKGKLVVAPGAPYDESKGWIKGPKDAGKAYVTAPYLWKIDGVDQLLVSICIPMYKDGEFIGSAGVDFVLKGLSKLVSSIKLYENGYGFIVDNNGIVVGHPKTDIQNKKLLEVVKNDSDYISLLKKVKKVKTISSLKSHFLLVKLLFTTHMLLI